MPKPTKEKSPFAEVADLLSSYGAGLIADHINAYWAKRGHMVNAERYLLPNGGGWGVRSDMVGGLPPAIRKAKLEAVIADIEAKRAGLIG